MKTKTRIITVFLAIILSTQFPSCTKEDDITTETENPAAHTDESQSEETTPETEPETEPFDMPPETNELVVYSNSMTRSVMTAAVNFFQEQYPDVDVTYENVSDDAYEQLLKTELAAGAGPDIVYTLDIYVDDVYKLMLSNIFMNLDGFMDNDDSFNKDDYIPGVFNSGVLNGKRYFAPIEFTAHSALTTQEILDEEGLTLDEIKTFDGYIDSIYNYNQKYADDPEKSAIYDQDPAWYEAYKLINSFGSTYINYENNKITINDTEKETFRTLMDGIRKIYDMPVVDSFVMGSDREGLTRHKCLYSRIDVGGRRIIPTICAALVKTENTPVIFIPQNPAGGVTGNIYSFAAIPEGAKNKLNAYRLMKILLSDEFQGGEGDTNDTGVSYLFYCPVRKDAVYKHIMSGQGTWEENPDVVKAVEQCAEVMMSVENAVLVPNEVRWYIDDEMTPYFSGEKDWDSCYNRLINVLTLYKDE